jgi:hypothetical protein
MAPRPDSGNGLRDEKPMTNHRAKARTLEGLLSPANGIPGQYVEAGSDRFLLHPLQITIP